MSDLTGQRLGQYQILARINKGSISTIYKAYQPKLDRFVAVKVLSPQVVDEEGFLDRFIQEARAVAQLDHPNIVPVYDFDQVGDIAYIVLKYVESGTLRAMMTGEPMDLGLAVDIVTQVGLALGYAHKRGVVHRDVKPSNILIGEGRWALLTDFGLAKILGGGRKLTRSGIGMGTPDYMAPEQAQGIQGDGRADLYSLGVTLYEMLTGRVPFEADSSMAVVVKHITELPPPPCDFNPDLPLAIQEVVLTAMAKEPDQRYQTAEAMVAALVRAAGFHERAESPDTDVAALSVARLAEKPAPEKGLHRARKAWRQIASATWGRPPRRAWLALAGGTLIALALVAVAVGTLVLWRAPTRASMLPTVMPARSPMATVAAKTTPAPTLVSSPTFEPIPILTPTATPVLVLIPSSAKITSGIYVKAIKFEGIVLRKGPSFDTDYLTTLPKDTILYVWQGPMERGNLWWIQLGAGNWIGWATQDEVAAFAVKPTP